MRHHESRKKFICHSFKFVHNWNKKDFSNVHKHFQLSENKSLIMKLLNFLFTLFPQSCPRFPLWTIPRYSHRFMQVKYFPVLFQAPFDQQSKIKMHTRHSFKMEKILLFFYMFRNVAFAGLFSFVFISEKTIESGLVFALPCQVYTAFSFFGSIKALNGLNFVSFKNLNR